MEREVDIDSPRLSGARRRLLHLLKRNGPMTAKALAAEAEVTDVAVRQILLAMEGLALVEQHSQPPAGKGRPAVLWSLTDGGNGMFPDHHAELTVGLIRITRSVFGEEGLARVIDRRADEQIEAYRKHLPPQDAPLKQRVEELARARTAEGYMAEVVSEKPGCYLLIENHCPICEAAQCCVGLCDAELRTFREALGDDVTVSRVQHLITGDRRCVYRIEATPTVR